MAQTPPTATPRKNPDRSSETRKKLINAGSLLVRKNGYTATAIDDVCAEAGVSKGAFFHHFKSKEDLIEICLLEWDQNLTAMEGRAPFQALAEPNAKVLGYMDLFIRVFSHPGLLKSCLVGTTVQEVADSNPKLRTAAHRCFANAERRFAVLLHDALRPLRKKPDAGSLAALWIATLQGSLVLYKASQDPALIPRNLEHTKAYIAGLLPAVRPGYKSNRTRKPTLKGRKRPDVTD